MVVTISEVSRMRRLIVVVLLLSVTIAGWCQSGALYRVQTTTPMMLALPGAGPLRVYVRVGDGKWRPAQPAVNDGRLTFNLDPAQLGAGTVMLLINPPAGLVMDDYIAPSLSEIKVDGQAQTASALLDLGGLAKAPARLEVTIEDKDNALDAGSIVCLVDGQVLAAEACQIKLANPKTAAVTCQLPQLSYGRHQITLRAQDTSPQTNEATMQIKFVYSASPSVVLAGSGVKVSVDSSYGGYESLAALNDGVTAFPGDHAGNDITWASAEVPSDHWVAMTLSRPRTLREVSVYWALFGGMAHTPAQFQVQVGDGSGWRTVYTSPEAGEPVAPVSTVRFEPVSTDRFRVFMPAGKGPAKRPNLLWIGEVEAR
jgi:hypothetical protein